MPHFIDKQEIDIHSLQVMIYAITLANALHLSDKELFLLGEAALFHDLGLKKIDDNIIYKKTKLTDDEMYEMHRHTIYSTEIIKQNDIINPFIIDAVLHHHEQYNGKGYPNQLEKKHISIFASILSICDVFDALTTQRSYRKNTPHLMP
jgi:HD-GYP domain-containing protein (c-di-GMP phosphodiesterase class II)